jgi:hypothetical protein
MNLSAKSAYALTKQAVEERMKLRAGQSRLSFLSSSLSLRTSSSVTAISLTSVWITWCFVDLLWFAAPPSRVL